MFGAADWVAYHAQHRGESLALGCAEDGRRTTWAQLEDRVAGAAATLRELGVGPGDRVALITENDPRVFEVQFACMRLGALFVPLNWRLHVSEIQEICVDARPGVIVHDGRWVEVAIAVAEKAGIGQRLSFDQSHGATDYESAISAAVPFRASGAISMDQPTHILYTSGTTGRPKGALSTNATLVWQALNTAYTTGYSQLASRTPSTRLWCTGRWPIRAGWTPPLNRMGGGRGGATWAIRKWPTRAPER